MHYALAMTMINGLRNLRENVHFTLLGQLIIIVVEIVHESHLHKVRHQANIIVVHIKVVQLKHINVVI